MTDADTPESNPYDLNEDGSIDIADYAILSGAFGQVGDD